MKPIRTLSLFSGIGAFEKALTRIGIPHEIVGFSEIDKYAIASYCAIHNVDKDKWLGDITKIDIESLPQDIDLLTHGSPCQSFSAAGKGAGGDKGTNTRSSLMWNSVEIIRHVKPRYVIWENVKNVLSAKHRHNFDQYLDELTTLGYTNYYKVLNSKDYGIPQNRERIFVISILGEHEPYAFPEPYTTDLRVKDFLEPVAEAKFYVSTKSTIEMIERFKCELIEFTKQNNRYQSMDTTKIDTCMQNALHYGNVRQRSIEQIKSDYLTQLEKDSPCEPQVKETDNRLIQEGSLMGGLWDNMQQSNKRLYSVYGIAPTIHTCAGGNIEPKVIVDEAILRYERTEYGKAIRKEYEAKNVQEKLSNMRRLVPRTDGLCNTLTTVQKDNLLLVLNPNFCVRKLMPIECWRLMGFSTEDYQIARDIPTSYTQLYKQAGNSIVVPTLEAIFKALFQI